MSEFNYEGLKSASDPAIPFLTRKVGFTTAQVLIDALQQFGMLIKSYRISNDDATNNVTYRTKNPQNTLEVIEPQTEGSNNEWTSFLEINPDGTTGSGTVELELVKPGDAQRK